MSRHYFIETRANTGREDNVRTEEFVTRDAAMHSANGSLACVQADGKNYDRQITYKEVTFIEKEITEEVIESRELWKLEEAE